MSTTRLINTVFREIGKAQKRAERDRIRRERNHLRDQKQLEKERLRKDKKALKERKETLKEKIRLSKEQIRLKKANLKKEWDAGVTNCETRHKTRNQLRLTFIR